MDTEDRAIIIRNSVVCNKCNTEIESTHRHDFVRCECGSVAVDGGRAYTRMVMDKGADYKWTGIYLYPTDPIYGLIKNKLKDGETVENYIYKSRVALTGASLFDLLYSGEDKKILDYFRKLKS